MQEETVLDIAHRLMTTKIPVVRFSEEMARKCLPLQLWSPKQKGNVGTWKPKDSETFTLIKAERTWVYCHSTDGLFFASPEFHLPDTLPDNTAFIGHFFLERGTPRFLIFDLLDHSYPDALARYSQLRSLSRFFPKPMCALQWVGDVGGITPDFIRKLPHEVAYVFTLHPHDPLFIHRQPPQGVSCEPILAKRKRPEEDTLGQLDIPDDAAIADFWAGWGVTLGTADA